MRRPKRRGAAVSPERKQAWLEPLTEIYLARYQAGIVIQINVAAYGNSFRFL